MTEQSPTFESLQIQLRQFVSERDWAAFHTPRNIALALVGEVGEVCQLLRWLPDASPAPPGTESELADVLIFLIHLADACEINIVAAAQSRLDDNRLRFPFIE